ncbi:putative amidohydrolase [Trematosphaeria pertusa]|uniref:Putative amidohydrolase n=1 Tax=Trematosphaeria pertusa TaxID=390896 RepID=A0A6A6IHA2_9PLEO|nr:putative amidohydrolase [Trematosphaeria pertusa]KAF2249262.1 putative amidohydrolase [Trematosphaeria pertusa]
MPTITVTNVRVFDGENVVDGLSEVSFDTSTGLIIPKADDGTIVDGTGCTLLPGLWDTHVHLSTPTHEETLKSIPLLKDMVACGITMAVDCGRMSTEHYELFRNEAIAPDIFYTGNFATSTGSTHSKMQMADAGSLVDTVEAAAEFVEERVKEGAHYIKIVADVPGPSQEIVNQLSKAAKEHGRMTIVHAACHDAFLMALNTEPTVSIITHVPMDGPVTLDEAKLMKAKGIIAVPTLVMCETICASGWIPAISFPPALESVKALHAAGVPILVGTDSNRSTIACVQHGQALWKEMELLAQAGLNPIEILNGATQLSADMLKVLECGVIGDGKRADLLLVQGDPTTDIQALRKVVKVWKAGKEIYQRADGA